MKSAKSLAPKRRGCFLAGQRKKKTKRFRYVRGGKQTLVCFRTVHSSTVSNKAQETSIILKIFSNIFKTKASTKYPIGLGLKELPNTIYQGKQPITSKEFKVFVNEHFAPKIKALGFKGRDFKYYREQKDYIECVDFWTYQVGGAIQVDLLVKFKGIRYPNENKEIKISNVTQENAEFLRRLSPHNISANNINVWFWLFHKEPKKNIETVNDIWSLFQSCGMDFFNGFHNHKKYISKIDSKKYMSFPDFYIKRISGNFEIGVVYFLFSYWKSFGDKSKAMEYAKRGFEIANGKEDVSYKTVFENHINGKSPVANKTYT